MNGTAEAVRCAIDTAGIDQFIKEKGISSTHGNALKQLVIRFNQDVTTKIPGMREQTEQSKRYLVGEAEGRLSHSARALLDRYAAADTLSLHFNRRTRYAGIVLFVFGCLAVIALEGYHLAHASPGEAWHVASRWAISGFVFFWLFALALWGLVHWRRWQDKYQDYRALAEAVRVQFFWHLAGLSDSVGDHYLRKHRGELAWIQYAIRTWQHPGDAQGTSGGELDAEGKKQLLLDSWILAQHTWFTKKAKEYERWKKGLAASAYALFLISLGVGTFLFIMLWRLISPGSAEEVHSEMTGWWGMVIGVSLVIAGTILGYRERRAIAEQANMFSVMSEIYEDTLKLYRANQGDSRDLILELGKDALSENADWLLMHRERPLEPKI